jgi:ATP synthase protein I
MNDRQRLREEAERQVQRMKQAEREQHTVLAQVAFLGTLGLVFVLPVIGGAYLGRWLDGMAEGYSMRWTLSLLFLGLLVGAFNVYRLVRER